MSDGGGATRRRRYRRIRKSSTEEEDRARERAVGLKRAKLIAHSIPQLALNSVCNTDGGSVVLGMPSAFLVQAMLCERLG